MTVTIRRLILWTLLALYAMGALLGSTNPIGFRVDWNIPFDLAAVREMWKGTDGFASWNYQNLGSSLFYPTLAPYLGIVSLLAFVIPSVGILERILMVCAFVLACEGMYKLARQCVGAQEEHAWIPAAFAAVSYGFSTYLFTKLGQGVLQEAFSYALLPIVSLSFLNSVRIVRVRYKIAASLSVGILIALAAVQTQYAVIACTIIVCVGVRYRAWIATLCAITGALLAESFVAIPLLSSLNNMVRAFQGETPLSEVQSWAPSLLEAVHLNGYVGGFASSAVAQSGMTPYWYVCGYVLCGMSLFAYFERRNLSGILQGVALCATVLLAALPSFAPDLYGTLLQRVPLMFLFRESYRFLAVAALLQALGIAYFVAWSNQLTIDGKLARRMLIAVAVIVFCWAFWSNSAVIGVVVAAALIVESLKIAVPSRFLRAVSLGICTLVVIGASPFVGVGLASQVQSVRVPPAAHESYEFLARSEEGRVLYLPFMLPMKANGAAYIGSDPTISWSPTPTFGNYLPVRISKQFASALYAGDENQIRMLADWLDIRRADVRDWIKDSFYGSVAAPRTGRFGKDAFTSAAAEPMLRKIGMKPMRAGSNDEERLFERDVLGSRAQEALPMVVDGDLSTATAVYKRGDVDAFVSQNSYVTVVQMLKAGSPLVVDGGYPYGLLVRSAPRPLSVEAGTEAVEIDADHGWGNQNAWDSWWWLDHRMMSPMENVGLVARIHSRTLTISRLSAEGSALLLLKYYAGPTGTTMRVDFGKSHWVVPVFARDRDAGYRWLALPVVARERDRVSITNDAQGDAALATVALIPDSVASRLKAQINSLLVHTLTAYVLHPQDQELFAGSRFLATLQMKCRRQPTLSLGGSQVPLQRHADGQYSADITINEGLSAVRTDLSADCEPGVLLPARFHPNGRTTSILRQAGASRFVEVGRENEKIALLSTGFSTLWRISDGRAIHFVANGYANGWLLSMPTAQLVITNDAESRLRIGEASSIVFVIFSLVFYLAERKREGRAQG